MHKFPDFDESTFMQLLSLEGKDALSIILADPNMLKPNYTGWTRDFSVDPEVTPHDGKGNASVQAFVRTMEPGVMSDMRAPLGLSVPMEQGNGEFYTAPIAHFTTKHFHETTATLYDKRVRYEELRDRFSEADANFILEYTKNLQKLMDGANMTLTWLCEQLMTNGYVYYTQGVGFKDGIYRANIPSSNFVGSCMFKVVSTTNTLTTWTDTDALLIDSLRLIVKGLNEKFGVDWKWQIDMPRAIWDNCVMKNKQVLELVRWINNSNGVSLPSVVYVTDEMVNAALASQSGLPTIVVHDTTQHDEVNGVVHGWKTGIVTARPLGQAGLIRHTTPIDAEFLKDGNEAIKRSYTPALMGLGFVENSIWPNGVLKEYRTRVIYTATPTLDEFPWHVIITTTSTSNNTLGDFASMS